MVVMKQGFKHVYVILLAAAMAFSGCASVGTVGMITQSSADPLMAVKSTHTVKELGPAQAEACRYFLLAIFPWGKSDLQVAVDKAVAPTGGNALVNVAVSSGLYGFIPIYNVLGYTCTTVKGTAIKIE
jgi:hypothetical protein